MLATGLLSCYMKINFFQALFCHLSILFWHLFSVGDIVHMRVTETQDGIPLYSDEVPVSSFTGIRIAPVSSDP